MAEERVLKARLQNKYETLENWNALTRGNFIPLKGELCFAMDKDNSYGYYKVGDGETDFVDLPWLINQSDWNEYHKKTPGYIKNRPMYTEIPDDSEPILEIGYKNQDGLSESSIIFNSVVLSCTGPDIDRTNIGTAWKVYAKVQSDIDIDPIELNIEGPVYLNSFGEDDPIYYVGNLYRWYKFYVLSEEGYSDLSEVPPELMEELELVLKEMGLTDTGENYAIANLYGNVILILFDQVPGDLNNFNYNFDIYSYTTTVHTIESKYLDEDMFVGKFDDAEEFSEIFNDYVNNDARGPYTHAEGKNTVAQDQAAHSEGENTQAIGAASHAEGYGTYVWPSAQGGHAEGINTTVCSAAGHAEGDQTYAKARGSHAEGYYTYAEGLSAHAEGQYSFAVGDYSHAEGCGSVYKSNILKEIIDQGIYTEEYEQLEIINNKKVNISGSINCLADIFYYNSNNKYINFTIDYTTGEIIKGTIDSNYLTQGYIPNAHCVLRPDCIGAVGDYTHIEGIDNTGIGEYNHVEGTSNLAIGHTNHITGSNNLSKGSINFIAGQYNRIEGNGQFALGYGLQDDGETGSNWPQILLGKYNEVVPGANLIVGAGNETARSNQLVLDNYGELQILKNRIVDGEKNIWKEVNYKSSSTYDKTFQIFYEEDCEFERSNLIKPNLIKLHYSMSSGTPYIYYRNGNILKVDELEDQILDNGTTITVDKENNCFIVDAKASEAKQRITFFSQFSDADYYVHNYYCWDELADSEIYYGVDGTTNLGNHLIHHYHSVLNDIITLDINIEPNVEKKITLPFPVLTTCVPPKKWVPPMEKILIPNDTKSVEIDISQYPFNGQVSMESPHKGTWYGTMYAVPKAVINENRMGMLLNQYIPENQYIVDLTQEDSNISLSQGSTSLSLSIKLGQKIDGAWVSNYEGITPKQLELVELFPEAMQSLMISDQNSGFKLPDGIFINNTTDSEWSMPTRALYDLMSGGNIANITDGHVRLEHGYNEFDTCYLKWYIGLGDGTDEEIEALFSGIMAQLATATHFIFYLPHGRNNIYLN